MPALFKELLHLLKCFLCFNSIFVQIRHRWIWEIKFIGKHNKSVEERDLESFVDHSNADYIQIPEVVVLYLGHELVFLGKQTLHNRAPLLTGLHIEHRENFLDAVDLVNRVAFVATEDRSYLFARSSIGKIAVQIEDFDLGVVEFPEFPVE